CTIDEAKVVLIPVPWDVTVSYGAGTAQGPAAIREASYQVDLYDSDNPTGWQDGIAMLDIDPAIESRAAALRPKAEQYIAALVEGESGESSQMKETVREITAAGEELRGLVRETALKHLRSQKIVGLVGGDHSTPLGFIDALASIHPEFGILQIDAHCDLREAYEGFRYSHASVMWNALQIPQVKKLVQVGIRDYAQCEVDLIEGSKGRVVTFFDHAMKEALYDGKSWRQICKEIVAALPQKVYLSFDIDGLDPKLCPNTGTPVPGGLEFQQAVMLIREVLTSGRTLIGFDLNEVSPGEDEWDANVGARMLFKICNIALKGAVR
ncbi:MAG: agmatinase, partial [Proteobacteria bacterium]|nr:agmatinase [Pseudomonadota bacterium]